MLHQPLYIAAYNQSRFGKLKTMQVPEIVANAVTGVCDEIDVEPALADVGSIGSACGFTLNDQGLLFLDLTAVNSPVDMVARTLKFCEVKFDPGPHAFTATSGDKSKNVGIIISGVVFTGRPGKKVLATQRYLSDHLVAFLTQKGYTYLALPPPKSPLQVKATVLPSTRDSADTQ